MLFNIEKSLIRSNIIRLLWNIDRKKKTIMEHDM
jgi:hypothetical protein